MRSMASLGGRFDDQSITYAIVAAKSLSLTHACCSSRAVLRDRLGGPVPPLARCRIDESGILFAPLLTRFIRQTVFRPSIPRRLFCIGLVRHSASIHHMHYIGYLPAWLHVHESSSRRSLQSLCPCVTSPTTQGVGRNRSRALALLSMFSARHPRVVVFRPPRGSPTPAHDCVRIEAARRRTS
jgi:hypothetical protein